MDTETLTDVASTAAQQMSMWDLVWASDMVTKVVMIGLIAASVWSWAIIIEKIGTLRQVKQFTKSFEEKFWSGLKFPLHNYEYTLQPCFLFLLKH